MAHVEKNVVVSAPYDIVSTVMMEAGPGLVRPESDRFVIDLGPRRIGRDVVTTIEPPFRETRPFRFTAVPFRVADKARPRVFPTLDAELEATARTDGSTDVTVDGWYDPPSKSLGDAIDAIGLHRLARRAIERHFGDVLTRVGTAVRSRMNSTGKHPIAAGGAR